MTSTGISDYWLFRHFVLIVSSLMAAACLLTFGCSPMRHKPDSISILATAPMSRTSISSYLSLDTLYQSNKNIVLLSHWGRVAETQGHTITWEIQDDKGGKLLSFSEEDFTIRPNMWIYFPVSIEGLNRKIMSPGGIKVNFYVDGNLQMTRELKYENKDLVSNNDQRVVILPFAENSKSPSPWDQSRKNIFRNTIADALYCELARIFPDAVPHYVSEQKLGKEVGQDCYDNLECMRGITGAFGEGIIIFGEMYIQKTYGDSSSLTVYVYDSRTKKFRQFHFFKNIDRDYAKLMHDLLKGVLYREGLEKYLLER